MECLIEIQKREVLSMRKNEERLLDALCCFLRGETAAWRDGINGEDWKELFQMAAKHQILPMIFEAVYACPAFSTFPEELAAETRKRVIRQVMLQNCKTEEFLVLYRELLDQGLAPLVVKGMICRSLYREPDFRASGDEDVLVPEEDFSSCAEIFRRNGMQKTDPEQREEDGEISWILPGGALRVELHRELFPSGSRAYGSFNSLFRTAFERKVCVEIRGVPVWTMCPTDHLLYLIVHAFKHFMHSGFGIRQVCDIVLFAGRFGGELDWQYLWEQCRNIRADIFAASLFRIGARWLGFSWEEAGCPGEWIRQGAEEEALLSDLLEGGVFGDSSASRKHSSNMTLAAVAGDRAGQRGRMHLRQALFPEREYMKRTYSYLQKYPFLMPVAWVSRLAKYAVETRRCRNSSAVESLKIGSRRIELLKKYRIIQ